jgi:hypothetical protein
MRRLALALLIGGAARARLVLPDVAPRGFNSFDDYPAESLNESKVLAMADAMKSQLLPFDYTYLVIDGGWTTTHLANGSVMQHLDEWGRPVAAPERYPHGMKWLADQATCSRLSVLRHILILLLSDRCASAASSWACGRSAACMSTR